MTTSRSPERKAALAVASLWTFGVGLVLTHVGAFTWIHELGHILSRPFDVWSKWVRYDMVLMRSGWFTIGMGTNAVLIVALIVALWAVRRRWWPLVAFAAGVWIYDFGFFFVSTDATLLHPIGAGIWVVIYLAEVPLYVWWRRKKWQAG